MSTQKAVRHALGQIKQMYWTVNEAIFENSQLWASGLSCDDQFQIPEFLEVKLEGSLDQSTQANRAWWNKSLQDQVGGGALRAAWPLDMLEWIVSCGEAESHGALPPNALIFAIGSQYSHNGLRWSLRANTGQRSLALVDHRLHNSWTNHHGGAVGYLVMSSVGPLHR